MADQTTKPGNRLVPTIAALAALVVLALHATPAAAASHDKSGYGKDLLKWCRAGLAKPEGSSMTSAGPYAARCGGLLEGFAQGFMYSNISGGRPNARDFCLPPSFTVEQLAKVVVDFIEKHPAELERPAGAVIFAAYELSFPCKPAAGKGAS